MRVSRNDSVAISQIREASKWRSRSRSPSRFPRDPDEIRTHRRLRSPLSQYAAQDRLIGDRVFLPYEAKKLPKSGLNRHRPLFAHYLAKQKGISIDGITKKEERGRWKSFIEKWNNGELDDWWYDPKNLEEILSPEKNGLADPEKASQQSPGQKKFESSDEDDYGPAPPPTKPNPTNHTPSTGEIGPTRPNIQDLQLKRELAASDADTLNSSRRADLTSARRSERALQRSRQDDLAPRAEPGTRERQLEKKREKADSNRIFAAGARGGDGGDVEIGEAELMGGGEGGRDGLEELKRLRQREERKRSEWEVRREEQEAARRAERDVKVRDMREREEKTMGMLKELAKARFGG